MFEVISNYLQPLNEAGIVNLTEESKPSEVYDQLRLAYKQGITGIDNCVRLFVPNIEEDEELVEYIKSNKELMRVINWTNRNILLKLGKVQYKTMGVHLRIVGSMLLKLKDSGKIREDVYFYIHPILTGNVLKAHYQIATEDLPF